MSELRLTGDQRRRLEEIYEGLQREYTRIARVLDFSCHGCPDNCCDSYFLHHTYSEWAYLFEGFHSLSAEHQETIRKRARRWLDLCRREEALGRRPQVMCPLNVEGLCVLYHHRLLVCRTHGVPARIVRPDGLSLDFPGCFRCQEIVLGGAQQGGPPRVERTPWLRQMALLEGEVVQGLRQQLPKVRKTIAEMLLLGPPSLPPLDSSFEETTAIGGVGLSQDNDREQEKSGGSCA
jgi:hypothetical protein